MRRKYLSLKVEDERSTIEYHNTNNIWQEVNQTKQIHDSTLYNEILTIFTLFAEK